jgi:ADP-ribose pyrophosphatase
VFSGGPIEAVNIERVRLPDGREIPDYYRIVLADYALVFAVTGEDRVLLLRQYKHGLGRVCVGFPGGALKAGEDPRAAAERELREESGYVSSSWRSLGSYVTNANQRCNVAHFFVASGCRRAGDATEPDLESPDLLLVPKEDLWVAVRLDELAGASHVALLALATHPMTSDVGSMGRR